MNREKQIEQMAKALTTYEKKLCDRLPKDKCLLTSAVHAQVSCDYCKIAEFLVNEGYRKASDVAEEIFTEIERFLVEKLSSINAFRKKGDSFYDGEIHALELLLYKNAELKKKYMEEGK